MRVHPGMWLAASPGTGLWSQVREQLKRRSWVQESKEAFGQEQGQRELEGRKSPSRGTMVYLPSETHLFLFLSFGVLFGS